jgi:hypothetical protein
MMSEHGSGGEAQPPAQPRHRARQEMLQDFPEMRGVFNALCDMGEGEDAAELLGFAARQGWVTDLARRAQSVGRLADTMPFEPEQKDLQETLWELYAASRVRDALLLAHQPRPSDNGVRGLGKELPNFSPVPVGHITQFFAAIGCQPVTEPSFDPILHEIITCEAVTEPDTPIQVTGQAWPALLIGELVFTRAGVRVRAGSEHAVPGIADRSTLHWEFWRRHRTTRDLSSGWGSNSQWRTNFRRDYITSRGHVYNFDALSGWRQQMSQRLSGTCARAPQQPLTADEVSFIKNRCQLRTEGVADPDCLIHRSVDERRP